MAAPTAQFIGNAFVEQYYRILLHSPRLVHQFYQDTSMLGRPDSDGAMSTITTIKAIKKKILSLNYGEFRAQINSVDAQDSYKDGIHVLVTGSLLGKDNMIQNFTQTVFLAPQKKGYFVLNDIFRYVEDIKHENGNQSSGGTDIEAPFTPEQDPSPVESHVSEQTVVPAEVNGDEGQNPLEGNMHSDGKFVIRNFLLLLHVMVMKESAMASSSPAPVPRRSLTKSRAQQGNTQASAPVTETPVSSLDAADSGNNEEGEADGYSINAKGLPMNTAPLLEDEFKKFGTIKAGGLQLRINKQGFCFGFVEFEVESAVQKAIEASPVSVGGRQAYVEENTTNSRGLESHELQVYVGDSCRQSSPSTSLEGGGGGPNYELYDQLEKAMVEEDKSLRVAFEESMRRREALKDAIDAVRMRERKDFEEALARKAKEVENMSQQIDKIATDRCIALDERLSLRIKIANCNQMVQKSELKYKMKHDDLQEQASNKITPLSFSLHEIEGATGNFDPSMKIGQWGYGPVYRGFLRHTQVAIKTSISQSMLGRSEFQQEVHILSRLRHPNLVTLIGSCPDACSIIYEYLPNGSLEDKLSCRDNSTPLSWKTRIRIAVELCSVLIFLHSDSVVHGDLKPDNILLDANYVCKLSDFGKCRVVNRNEESSNTTQRYATVPKGSFGCIDPNFSETVFGYIDPNFFETGKLTQSSDVYSFGVILLQLLTGNKPVVGLPAKMRKALDGGRLKDVLDPTVEDWPFVQAQQLAHLAMRCCKRNRRCRPDLASEVWRLLEPMRASCDTSSFHVSSDESRRTPPYFICPILQDIMIDPHVAADGYTYELEALRGWIDGGHSTSPMTNLQLQHSNVVPNHSLRSAIQEWQQLQRR